MPARPSVSIARCSSASISTFGGTPSSTLTTQSPQARPRTTQLSQSMIIPSSDPVFSRMPGTLCDTTDNFGFRAGQHRIQRFTDARSPLG